MKTNILQMLSAVICGVLSVTSLFAQNFPPNGTVAEEIAMGGPSKDYLTLEFPRNGVATCAPHTNEKRTIGGDLDKYGKALLVIIFPKDCPYCIDAADVAGEVISKYRDKLTVWYVSQRLNGDGYCADINEMKNKYPFIKDADFSFIDIWMRNSTWNDFWHYPEQDSYFSKPEMPSVYRIFSPKTRKVTGISYYVGPIENQIKAAIAENRSLTNIASTRENISSYELFPNPANDQLNLNFHLKHASDAIITITNALGKEVMRKEIESGANFNQEINIRDLQNDIYMISVVSNGNTIISDRFVKF